MSEKKGLKNIARSSQAEPNRAELSRMVIELAAR